MASQAQFQREKMMEARRKQWMQRVARQQQVRAIAASQSQQIQGLHHSPLSMGTSFDDLPILEPHDLDQICDMSCCSSFDIACRNGPASVIEQIATSQPRTPAFLHRGLLIALRAGNVDATRVLLSHGAPIVRQTPDFILEAPDDKQIKIFELFFAHGWTPNTPGLYGAVLLPRIIRNLPLLSWFLTHGANPNLGRQRHWHDRHGASDAQSCSALESAAAHGSLEAVRMLLATGARIQNGAPLHYAAGVCPLGTNPHANRVKPSKDFDEGRIPVMRLLVENGADVNYKVETPQMEPQYAIMHAVMAGAIERVKWLLENGADPFVKGNFGSAVSYAAFWGEEMVKAIQEGLVEKQGRYRIAVRPNSVS